MKYKGEHYKLFKKSGGGTFYFVSKTGKCISKKVHIHELKVYETKKGYLYVKLSILGDNLKYKTRAEFLHRMVAKVYIPNPKHKPEVNHKDGDKHNNCVDNLEWVTSKENKIHAKKNNLVNYAYGENSGKAVCTNKDIEKACKLMVENKLSLNEISKKLNIPVDTLYQIRSRGIWNHITDKYTFPEIPKKDYKYDNNKIIQICEMLSKGIPDKEISKKLDVGISTVKDIKNKRRHKNISKDYNF